MKRFEYLIIIEFPYNENMAEMRLIEHGMEGWELVAVVEDKEKQSCTFYLKREVQ